MTEIPGSVMEEARAVVAKFPNSMALDPLENRAVIVARAILAAEKRGEERERERAKLYWQKWAAKRLEINRSQWLKAAKFAIAGDMRDLRNRVELAEAPYVEVVLSDAAIRKGSD